MNLSFFNHAHILETTQQFFRSVLEIPIAPAAKSEINLTEFLKEQLTDVKLLGKVDDARFVGMINNLTLQGKTEGQDAAIALKLATDDYDMLLVFGIELNENFIPTKTDISRLTRALNRRSFSRPVVLIIKYGSQISFSSAERGQYKKAGQQGEKIGRISILRDIDTNQVHAGHERILLQLRINPLKVSIFKELYAQWQEVFNLKTLNNDFYKKIADWYFWATKVVKFPTDHYKLKNGNSKSEKELQTEANQIALIRFLTRIIFVWFLKSKSNRIVPEEIFDKVSLQKHLKFNDEFESNYYKAILQNLFFASFNTKIDSEQRTFSSQKRKTFLENRFRYASLFVKPNESAKQLFANIPFLNGGLFSNLDYKESKKPTVRVDWFSDPEPDKKYRKNELYFPDILFFDNEHEEDLSDFYESNSKRKVKGLISILKEYYFTIEENTPLEQEIALDPELLGKIFENLLASYNPETRTTARKLTGSFYTPREIVNYMVDESLIAYLKTKLNEKTKAFQQFGNKQINMFGNEGKVGQLDMHIDLVSGKWDKKENELESKLRDLFAYESEENPFNGDAKTTNAIIAHLSECKILDPACGSGAFPMGVLHQIVHALKKLDQDNEQWKRLQYERLIAPEVAKITSDISVVQKLSSEEARIIAEKQLQHELEELLENFVRHDHNYTRKLHLIQECIYGVDIQPIAIHISKLRFFISLLVDQNIDFSQRDKNYQLNSLPNLETKFVAANTLIPLNPGGQLKTRETDVVEIEDKIKAERKKYFDCKSREQKIEIEKADEALRIAFAAKLKELTEQGRNNLKIQIQKIEEDIELRHKFKAKAQSDKDKTRITKGIEQLKKDREKLIDQMAQFASGDEVADKILNFNPYDANTSAPFFDPEIMFALQPDIYGGFFNVVMGNPPYGAELGNTDVYKKLFPESSIGNIDSYKYFIDKSTKLLNFSGGIYFITSDSYLEKDYFKDIRELLLKRTSNIENIKLGDNIFENVNLPTAIIFAKKGFEEFMKYSDVSDCSLDLKIIKISERKKYFNASINFTNKVSLFKKPSFKSLIDLYDQVMGVKVYQVGKGNPKQTDYEIANEVFVSNKKNGNEWLPFIDDGIKRYSFNPSKKFIKYGEWLAEPRKPKYFLNPKILIREVVNPRVFACFVNDDYVVKNTAAVIIEKEKEFDLYFLLGIVNSKLFNFYIHTESPKRSNLSFPSITSNLIKNFPISLSTYSQRKLISDLVEQIVSQYSFQVDNKLDLMVYKLYTLTYDECKIVDPEIEKLISRKDYERMSIEELAEYEIK